MDKRESLNNVDITTLQAVAPAESQTPLTMRNDDNYLGHQAVVASLVHLGDKLPRVIHGESKSKDTAPIFKEIYIKEEYNDSYDKEFDTLSTSLESCSAVSIPAAPTEPQACVRMCRQESCLLDRTTQDYISTGCSPLIKLPSPGDDAKRLIKEEQPESVEISIKDEILDEGDLQEWPDKARTTTLDHTDNQFHLQKEMNSEETVRCIDHQPIKIEDFNVRDTNDKTDLSKLQAEHNPFSNRKIIKCQNKKGILRSNLMACRKDKRVKSQGRKIFRVSQVPKSHITVTDGPPTSYLCTVCNKRFSSRVNVRYHNYCGVANKPFTCDLCEKGFVIKSHYEYHQKMHTGDLPFVCSTCGKGFRQRGKLNRHLIIHTGERPHMCLECGVGVADKSSLKNHERIHTGERPYSCRFCGRTFAESSNMKKHLMIHSDEKPFVCGECGRSFTHKFGLRAHVMTVHSAERPHQCKLCCRSFSLGKDLRRHTAVHSAFRPFTCTMCNQAFRRKDNFERHMRSTYHSEVVAVAKARDDINNQDRNITNILNSETNGDIVTYLSALQVHKKTDYTSKIFALQNEQNMLSDKLPFIGPSRKGVQRNQIRYNSTKGEQFSQSHVELLKCILRKEVKVNSNHDSGEQTSRNTKLQVSKPNQTSKCELDIIYETIITSAPQIFTPDEPSDDLELSDSKNDDKQDTSHFCMVDGASELTSTMGKNYVQVNAKSKFKPTQCILDQKSSTLFVNKVKIADQPILRTLLTDNDILLNALQSSVSESSKEVSQVVSSKKTQSTIDNERTYSETLLLDDPEDCPRLNRTIIRTYSRKKTVVGHHSSDIQQA